MANQIYNNTTPYIREATPTVLSINPKNHTLREDSTTQTYLSSNMSKHHAKIR